MHFTMLRTSLCMIVKSYQIVSKYFKGFKTSLNMFRHESHQFVSEVLQIQDKSQHVCRIVSIRIRYTCLDMFDESRQFLTEVLEIHDKFQHVGRIVSICIRETCLDLFDESNQSDHILYILGENGNGKPRRCRYHLQEF